jgi:hypothetical protein
VIVPDHRHSDYTFATVPSSVDYADIESATPAPAYNFKANSNPLPEMPYLEEDVETFSDEPQVKTSRAKAHQAPQAEPHRSSAPTRPTGSAAKAAFQYYDQAFKKHSGQTGSYEAVATSYVASKRESQGALARLKGVAAVLQERLLDINPGLDIRIIEDYIHEDNVAALLDPIPADVVIDAIDTLSPKIALIQYCLKRGLKLVSSMGAGAKLDATAIRIDDISKTRECPLAHALRKRLHRLGIHSGFTAVYSTEKPHRESVVLEESRNKRSQVGTISYLPAVFGCACAQAALREWIDIH